MASIFDTAPTTRKDFAKRMSSHLAGALICFCLLQIFIVAKMGGSVLLHFGIILAIGGFALAARGLERRWQMLETSGLSERGLARRFRRDLIPLWAIAIGGAFLWVPIAILLKTFFD